MLNEIFIRDTVHHPQPSGMLFYRGFKKRGDNVMYLPLEQKINLNQIDYNYDSKIRSINPIKDILALIQIKLLIKFCGLDWDPNCLESHKNTKTIKTVSFAQARKPIYKSSVNSSSKYFKYLNKLKSVLKS